MDIDPLDRHDVPRHEVRKVICSICSTEQDVQQTCITCGVCMGKYFCEKCNFFDDDDSKQQYHCDGCGICRTGGKDNFFHCYKCGCCYSILMKDSHPCVEKAMHHNCPVCFEYLFDSTKNISVMPCGHTIHMHCLKEMHEHLRFACPMCSKSVCDMSKVWEKLDQEIAATKMPEAYQNKMVWILCNDCGVTSEVNFHILAHKCRSCNSYNTRQTRGGPSANSCTSSLWYAQCSDHVSLFATCMLARALLRWMKNRYTANCYAVVLLSELITAEFLSGTTLPLLTLQWSWCSVSTWTKTTSSEFFILQISRHDETSIKSFVLQIFRSWVTMNCRSFSLCIWFCLTRFTQD